MKLTIRKSSFFFAIAMTIKTLLRIFINTTFFRNRNTSDAIWYSCNALLLFSIIILGISLIINRKQIPLLSKSLKIQALIIGLLLIFEITINILESNYFWGFSVLPYYRSNTILLLFITIWFWQFAFITPQKLFSSKYLGKTSLVISITIGIVLLLMLISFIHVLFTGHVIGFRTTYLVGWIIQISFCFFYGIYLLDLSKNKRKDLTK